MTSDSRGTYSSPLRKNHHAGPREAFMRLETVVEVVAQLFGPPPAKPCKAGGIERRFPQTRRAR
jgi:hypothetical protein